MEKDTKKAWGSESPELQSPAAGTLAGMQRPVKFPGNEKPPKFPVKPFQNVQEAMRNSPKSVSMSKTHDSSLSSVTSSSLEDTTESESDITTSAVNPPRRGMAPPPPLRNIPHQTPSTTPTSSQILERNATPPLGTHNSIRSRPSSGSRRVPLPVVVKLPTKISVLPGPSRPLQGLPSTSPQVEIGSTKPFNVLSQTKNSSFPQPFQKPIAVPHSGTKTTAVPQPSATSNHSTEEPAHSPNEATPLVRMDPVLTSTPKAKRTHFPGADGSDSVPAIEEPPHPKLEAVAPVETVQRESVPSSAASMANAIADNVTIQTSPKAAISPLPVQEQQHLPLQRSRVSWKLSSLKRESDSESISSSSESEHEERDTFDPDIQRRMLPIRTATLAPMAGRPVLPPLSSISRGLAAARPPPMSVLPPIVRGAGRGLTASLPFVVQPPAAALPSYQEASTAQRAAVSPVPSNHTQPPTQPAGLGAGTQELSQHPIHMAALEGVNSSQMKSLALQHGVDFRDVGGRTPLMYAVQGNQPKMCEVLLKLKAQVNAMDLSGLTPLLWATYRAKADIIRILLKNSADVHQTDQDGRTAFHWAMKTPNIHCLKWLCKHANVTEVVNKPDNDGLVPLHWAVMSDQASHIKLLLSQTKADVSAQDQEGRGPLNYAILNYSPSCIRAILDHNEGAVSLADVKGRTALHYACAEGSADCVRTLLSYRKCDIQCADCNGTTPLHWAAAANQAGLVQLLLRRGADRGQRDLSDYTPLDYAEQRGHTECVRILRSYGLQRPGSALSLASRVSVNMATDPPILDEQGHVVFRRFSRQFSLSSNDPTATTSSSNRLPADGQAQSESPVGEVRVQEGAGGGEERGGAWEERDGEANVETTERLNAQLDHQHRERVADEPRRRGWKEALFCGCFTHRSNAVTPL